MRTAALNDALTNNPYPIRPWSLKTYRLRDKKNSKNMFYSSVRTLKIQNKNEASKHFVLTDKNAWMLGAALLGE